MHRKIYRFQKANKFNIRLIWINNLSGLFYFKFYFLYAYLLRNETVCLIYARITCIPLFIRAKSFIRCAIVCMLHQVAMFRLRLWNLLEFNLKCCFSLTSILIAVVNPIKKKIAQFTLLYWLICVDRHFIFFSQPSVHLPIFVNSLIIYSFAQIWKIHRSVCICVHLFS